jgi:hypothetical protein
MCFMRTWISVLSVILLSQSALHSVPESESLWVAFRYASDHVISYVQRLQDPVQISMKDVTQSAAPLTRDSSCGYHLPLTPERLRTFAPDPENVPAIGRRLTVLLGGDTKVVASVDGYIEEWVGDSDVAVAVLARVAANDLARFRSAPSNYFLMSLVNEPVQPALGQPDLAYRTARTTLNRFGLLGDLIELKSDAGRDITLYRMNNGAMQPTRVTYACRD